jgi:hypothetical protein
MPTSLVQLDWNRAPLPTTLICSRCVNLLSHISFRDRKIIQGLKITIFTGIKIRLVDDYDHFRGKYYLHYQDGSISR